MKNWKRIGYVSVEAVITAALILAVGFFALLNLSGTGSQLVQNGINKLDGLNLFGASNPGGSGGYDDNGYPDDLNVNPGDINPVSDFTFELNTEGDGYILVSYNNTTDFDVVIPREYEGLPVMAIGESAFDTDFTATPLTSVAIPNSIKEIGVYAFYGNAFPTVIIPGSVTVLNNYAFRYNVLSHVTFLGNIPETLGQRIFGSNNLLIERTILVPHEQLTAYKAIASSAFDVMSSAIYSSETPIPTPIIFDETRYPDELGIQADDVNPESDFTFEWNDEHNGWTITNYLNTTDKTVVIPAGRNDGFFIVSVGWYAFDSKGIDSVALPNTIVTIDDFAFNNNNLQTVIFPDSILTIGNASFNNNNFPESEAYIHPTLTNTDTIVSYAGADMEVVIPDGTKVISENAFRQIGITSVTFPAGLVEIGEYAFRANDLASVSFPGSLTKCGNYSFYENPRLPDPTKYFSFAWDNELNGWAVVGYNNSTIKNIVIPSARWDLKPVVAIGDNIHIDVLANKGLLSVEIPDSVVAIRYGALKGNLLTEIVLPNNLQEMQMNAFHSNKLTSVVFPSSLKEIPSGAFTNNLLTSVTLPEGVEEIGSTAFANNQITSVSFPSTLHTISVQAFESNKFESIVIPATITELGQYAFRNNLLTSASFEEGSQLTWMKNSIFENNKLTTFTIPESVTRISSDVFKNNLLTSITFPSKLDNMEGWTILAGNPITTIRFTGPLPTTIGVAALDGISWANGSIEVPSAYLADYQAAAGRFDYGLTAAKFAGY